MSKTNFDDIKAAMAGRELAFLRSAGLSEKQLSGKHQACPGCGGTDRYRTNKIAGDGSFFCGQGGGTVGGNWIDHLCHTQNMSASDVYHLAVDFLGIKDMEPWDKARSQNTQSDIAKQVKLKDDNAYFNHHLKSEMDELIYLMEGRGALDEVDGIESNQAKKIIAMLNKRYITKTAVRPEREAIQDSEVSAFKENFFRVIAEHRDTQEVA